MCVGEVPAQPWDIVSDTTFLRGPYLQSVMGDQAIMVWRVDQAVGDGCVLWSIAGGEDQTTCVSPDANGQYEAVLGGLPRDTLVTYQVSTDGRSTSPMTFRSAPEPNRPVRLLVFGDAHRNEQMLGEISVSALADGVDAVVAVGDSVDTSEDAQFDQFLGGLRPLLHRVPLWPVIGNHEGLGREYFEAIVVPGASDEELTEQYYAVRIGDVWMASLSLVHFQLAYAFGRDFHEVTWLREALASSEARSARWRLLFIHEPPFCAGWGHCDGYHGEDALREVLLPMAESNGVAAVFSGHMHGYEHGVVNNTHLFVSGGAGGGLDQSCATPSGFPNPWTATYEHHVLTVDAACDVLRVEARSLDGTTLEATEIAHTP